jgi:superfamily II DNA helicase RecQ
MEMLAISGVGENKLDHYGDEFIEVIAAHEENELA